MTADASGPMLAGLPVLELSEMVAGPYAAKLLGDLGAHIVKVEPPTGDPARRIGPFVGGVVDPDHSVLFLHLNTSKTSVCLDPDAADHATALASLAGWAELIITDRSPEQLAEVGLDPDALLTAHPGLVILSITPFGTSGPYRGYRADPLTTFHGAGEGYLTPVASHLMPEVVDRPPLRQGRFAAEYKLATYAATLALAAVVHARRTGVGQVVDLSKQDAAGRPQLLRVPAVAQLWGDAHPGVAGRAPRRHHAVQGRPPAVHLPRGAPVAGAGQAHRQSGLGGGGVGGHDRLTRDPRRPRQCRALRLALHPDPGRGGHGGPGHGGDRGPVPDGRRGHGLRSARRARLLPDGGPSPGRRPSLRHRALAVLGRRPQAGAGAGTRFHTTPGDGRRRGPAGEIDARRAVGHRRAVPRPGVRRAPPRSPGHRLHVGRRRPHGHDDRGLARRRGDQGRDRATGSTCSAGPR